mmetsp:Transcript_58254/g.115623  ORF Transcript_58254/g.115623 Transcript_58254/m.115623 type:complete len:201 (+) Transcript_58254:171-773(+)
MWREPFRDSESSRGDSGVGGRLKQSLGLVRGRQLLLLAVDDLAGDGRGQAGVQPAIAAYGAQQSVGRRRTPQKGHELLAQPVGSDLGAVALWPTVLRTRRHSCQEMAFGLTHYLGSAPFHDATGMQARHGRLRVPANQFIVRPALLCGRLLSARRQRARLCRLPHRLADCRVRRQRRVFYTLYELVCALAPNPEVEAKIL